MTLDGCAAGLRHDGPVGRRRAHRPAAARRPAGPRRGRGRRQHDRASRSRGPTPWALGLGRHVDLGHPPAHRAPSTAAAGARPPRPAHAGHTVLAVLGPPLPGRDAADGHPLGRHPPARRARRRPGRPACTPRRPGSSSSGRSPAWRSRPRSRRRSACCSPRASGPGSSTLFKTATVWFILLAWPIYLTVAIFAPVLVERVRVRASTTARSSSPSSRRGLPLRRRRPARSTCCCSWAGRSSLSMVNNLVALITNIVLNLALIPSMGLRGAALAWSASVVLTNLLPTLEVHHTMGYHPYGRAWLRAVAGRRRSPSPCPSCSCGPILGPDRLGLAVGVTSRRSPTASAVYSAAGALPPRRLPSPALRRGEAPHSPRPATRQVVPSAGTTMELPDNVNTEAVSPASVDITDYVAVVRRHMRSSCVACGGGPAPAVAGLHASPDRRSTSAAPRSRCRTRSRATRRRRPSTPPPSSRCSSPRASRSIAAEKLDDRAARSRTCAPTSAHRHRPRDGSSPCRSEDSTAREAQRGAEGVHRRLHPVPHHPDPRTRSTAGPRRCRTGSTRSTGHHRRAAARRSTGSTTRTASRASSSTSQISRYTNQRSQLRHPAGGHRQRGRSQGAQIITPAILPSEPRADRTRPQRPARSGRRSGHRHRPGVRAGPVRRAGARERRRPWLHRRAEPRRDPGAAGVDALPALLARRGARTRDDAGRRVPAVAHGGHHRRRRGWRQGHRRHQRGRRRGQVDRRGQPRRHDRAERPSGAAHLGRPAATGRREPCSRYRRKPGLVEVLVPRGAPRGDAPRRRVASRCSRPAGTTAAPPTCSRRPRCARSCSRPVRATTSRSSTPRRFWPSPTSSASPRWSTAS